jgi:thymidylate synthase ThyX
MSSTTDEAKARDELKAALRTAQLAHFDEGPLVVRHLWEKYDAALDAYRDAVAARAREEGARTVLTNFLLAENGRLFDGEVDHLVTAYLKVAP